MNKTFNIRCSLLISMMLILVGGTVSCNSDSSSSDEEVAVTSSTVAVNSFSLSANKKVMSGLDSVFFSIDLNNAVIFNADSLPKGADVTKLVPVISFASSMRKAEIAVVDEKGDTLKKVDYLKVTTDSIDFTQKVTLDVTSWDGLNSLKYRLKVNVHQQNPDSIGWNKIDVAKVPSRMDVPLKRKTVVKDSGTYSLVEEADNTYSLCKGEDIFSNTWDIAAVSFPFTPKVNTLTASADNFYILSEDGTLYSSADFDQWTSLASDWVSLIGIYGKDRVVGIKNVNDQYCHSYVEESVETVGNTIPGDFPVSATSTFVSVSNKWAEQSVSFFVGGVLRNGTLSNATWGYDGNTWAILCEETPALEGPGIVKYTMYRNTSSTTSIRDFDAWVMLGGRDSDNLLNRKVYVSYDNGISWKTTGDSMNLPDSFPDIEGADIFSFNKKESADLSDGWKNVATRASYEIVGTEIIWDCPYIFIVGGYLPSGELSPEIWRGVLMRLNFTPII